MGRWAVNPQFAEQLGRVYEEWSGIFLSKKFDATGFQSYNALENTAIGACQKNLFVVISTKTNNGQIDSVELRHPDFYDVLGWHEMCE